MTFIDEQLVGDSKTFIRWSIENYNFEDCRNQLLYETLRKEAYADYIRNTKVILKQILLKFCNQ